MTAPVAIITGAGSGIGAATALRLGRLGYRLALVGRTESKIARTGQMIADQAPEAKTIWITTDLAKAAAADTTVATTLSAFGRVDALINNAGIASRLPISETSAEMLDETLCVNVRAPVLLIARLWPTWAEQTAITNAPSPCVVNVSTMGTKDPFPGFFVYAASKCAVESLVRSVAVEGRDMGVRGFAVAPGAVETPLLRSMFSEEMIPREQTIAPDRIAEVIVACVRGKYDQQNGSTIYVSE